MNYSEILKAARDGMEPHLLAVKLDSKPDSAFCPGCDVPYIASIAIYDLEKQGEEEAAATVRLACGELVGERGMERWLECQCGGIDK